jgi:hypothetical protein
MLVSVFFLCTLLTGPRVQRAPGIPCALCLEGKGFSGKPRAHRAAGMLSCVCRPSLRGAKATKQSILPLRGEMDCFASARGDGVEPFKSRLRSLHALLRVAGRGRGWGVYQRAPLAANLPKDTSPPPTPPHRFAGGGEKNCHAMLGPRSRRLLGSVVMSPGARPGRQ